VFAKRVRLFKYVPFAEFVFLAGSMAVGRMHEDSDFDVIVGVREGRAWTTWFLSSLIFQLRGWREHPGVNKSNRVAMTHFASVDGYKLEPPYDNYKEGGYAWHDLYMGMIPAIGDESGFDIFFKANDWMNPKREYKRHEKYIGGARSAFKKFWEFVLGGWFGDFIEKVLRKWLTKRLEDESRLSDHARVRYDDHRIEVYRG